MQVIYDMNTDLWIYSNPSGFPMTHSEKHKNNITIHFDIHGKAIGMDVEEASIYFGTPKMILKQLAETM